MADVAVLGQVGRDLVLRLTALPDAGGSVPVAGRRELLGGKGAKLAVAHAGGRPDLSPAAPREVVRRHRPS
jgi:ribokinase